MRFFVLLLSLIIQSVLCSQDLSPLENANLMYENQDYQSAFQIFDSYIASDSANYPCVEKAGRCAQRLGDFKKAKELFHYLAEADTTNSASTIQLATIYETEKNTPKAIKYYTKLTKLFETNPLYKRKLARQYHQAGLGREAFRYYGEANKLNPRDILTINGLAELFMQNGQYPECDSILREGLKVDDENINLHLLYAMTKYKQKQYDSTTMVLYNIRGDIDFTNYYNKMWGFSYLQIDSLDRAIVCLEKSLVDESNPENAHYYLGIAYEKKEDIETSLFHFNKAAEAGISTNQSLYHRSLARLYDQEGDLKNAILHYKDAYKYSEDPLLLFFLARASDAYYADKNVAINYYSRYQKSNHDNNEYKAYAKDRKKYLKEQIHFKKL